MGTDQCCNIPGQILGKTIEYDSNPAAYLMSSDILSASYKGQNFMINSSLISLCFASLVRIIYSNCVLPPNDDAQPRLMTISNFFGGVVSMASLINKF